MWPSFSTSWEASDFFFFFFKQKRETDFVYKGGKIKPGRKTERNRYESS